jgi:leader peptidase (prepilin peptidase)/N-methyltransferase
VTDLPPWLLTTLAAVLGLVLGSFLNVCIVRWGAEPKQSVVRPRSRCPRCGAELKPWDNIPVLSWLLLRGKCRSCGLPISPMYPLVELTVGVIWAAMAWRFGLTLHALAGAILLTILLGIAVTDFRNYIIPDEFTLGGLAIGLLLSLEHGLPGLGTAVLGAAVGFGTLWLVGYVGTLIAKKEAMGGGDIKMMAMVGAFIGWQGILLTIFLGALIGTLVFVPITLFKRDKLVPFGIFLALGGAAAWIAGPDIIAWYRSFAGL